MLYSHINFALGHLFYLTLERSVIIFHSAFQVKKFVQADLEQSISLFDLIEANVARRSLANSSEAFSSIAEAAGYLS